jgi:acyl dehydratase
MSLDALVVGTELPEYRVSATPTHDAWENKIHEDGLAREFGFRGGLVPGVTVYAWMTRPVVAALGGAWLDHGRFSVRFAKPVYFGQPITVRTSVAAHSKDEVTIQARVVNDEDEVCATATMGLPLGPLLALPELAAYPAAPLPVERPVATRVHLAGHPILGSPELLLERSVVDAFLTRVSDTLPVYRDADAPAHPGLYLDQANRALDRNVRVSPWIHVESHGQHLTVPRLGERLATRAKVKNLFQGKGHEFVELDLLLVAEGTRPVASIRHVAIYQLRATG